MTGREREAGTVGSAVAGDRSPQAVPQTCTRVIAKLLSAPVAGASSRVGCPPLSPVCTRRCPHRGDVGAMAWIIGLCERYGILDDGARSRCRRARRLHHPEELGARRSGGRCSKTWSAALAGSALRLAE